MPPNSETTLVSRPRPNQEAPLEPAAAPPASPPRLIRSRRRRWLELNPSYFASASADLELSEPLAYDRLVRRHQSAAEREAAGRQRGLADALTSSFLRGEAKTAVAIRHGAQMSPGGDVVKAEENFGLDWSIEDEGEDEGKDGEDATQGQQGEAETRATPRAQGLRKWRQRLEERFVSGEDGDFDYGPVDEDEELDGGWGERSLEDRWFEEEDEEGGKGEGETGVQDF